MKQQLEFSEKDLRKNNYKTRKELFLAEIEVLITWVRLVTHIESCYPKVDNGRKPYPLESMLRAHHLQQS